MSKIIAICGFSGAGKDTIAKYISEHYGYKMVISTTSRPMREGESESNPYHFVSKEDFQHLIDSDALIEHRDYHTTLNGVPDTWYYGIEQNTIKPDTNYVVVLDLWGLSQFKEHYNNVISFFIDVPDRIRKNRAVCSRPDFDELEWRRRLLDDRQKFTDEEISKYVDFKVLNLNLNQCIQEIMKEVNECSEKQL